MKLAAPFQVRYSDAAGVRRSGIPFEEPLVASSLTVQELRQELRGRGQDASGRKTTLVARLEGLVAEEGLVMIHSIHRVDVHKGGVFDNPDERLSFEWVDPVEEEEGLESEEEELENEEDEEYLAREVEAEDQENRRLAAIGPASIESTSEKIRIRLAETGTGAAAETGGEGESRNRSGSVGKLKGIRG